MSIFRQLSDPQSSTYTYLLGDRRSREAVIIDPVFEQAGRDIALIKELGLKLLWTLETHIHADHVTGAWLLKRQLGSLIGLSKDGGAEGADRYLAHGDRIDFGGRHLRVRATPGHTNGCLSYVLDDEFDGPLGHIREAKLIPLGDLAKRMGELARDQPVVTVCRSGTRSAQAAVILRREGFDTVANLAGGLLRWRGEGHAVEGGRIHKPSFLFAYLKVRLVNAKSGEPLGERVVEIKGNTAKVTERGIARMADQIDETVKGSKVPSQRHGDPLAPASP